MFLAQACDAEAGRKGDTHRWCAPTRLEVCERTRLITSRAELQVNGTRTDAMTLEPAAGSDLWSSPSRS